MKDKKTTDKQSSIIKGILMILFGYMVNNFSTLLGGNETGDFLSGLMGGVSIGIMLYGAYITLRSFFKKRDDGSIDED